MGMAGRRINDAGPRRVPLERERADEARPIIPRLAGWRRGRATVRADAYNAQDCWRYCSKGQDLARLLMWELNNERAGAQEEHHAPESE